MPSKTRGEQCFMHLATYRLDDLRTAETSGSADLGPDVFEPTITDALATALTERLTDVCVQHGWHIVEICADADRVELLITGLEPEGDDGSSVAAALDAAVYGAGAQSAVAFN